MPGFFPIGQLHIVGHIRLRQLFLQGLPGLLLRHAAHVDAANQNAVIKGIGIQRLQLRRTRLSSS